jgi:hypothetical protein
MARLRVRPGPRSSINVRIASIDVENGRISLTQALSKLLVGARASHHHLTGPFL